MERIQPNETDGKDAPLSHSSSTPRETLRGGLRIAACILVAAVGAALLLSDSGSRLELRAFDAALNTLPEPETDDGIVIVGIDDQAVNLVGNWPWGRDLIGDGLITMRSLGASQIVLDIEYPDASPVVVDAEQFQGDVDAVFGTLGSNLMALADAIGSGQLPAESGARFLSDLGAELQTDTTRRDRLAATIIDRDTYLGNSLAAIGTSIVPFSWRPEEGDESFSLPPWLSTVDVQIAENLSPAEAQNSSRNRTPRGVPTAGSLVTAIPQIGSRAAASGFVNTVIDPDGVKRRSNLLIQSGDSYLPAIGLVPLMLDGYTDIRVTENEYLISSEDDTLRLRRAADGSVLFRWHRGQIQDGFQTISYARIIELDTLLLDIEFNLRLMQDAGYLNVLDPDGQFFAAFEAAEQIRAEMTSTGDTRLMDQYRPRIETFVSDAARVAAEDSQALLLDLVNQQPASDALDRIREQIVTVFESTRGLIDRYAAIREGLEAVLDDAVVFVGFTATSTSDLGVTPFEEQYLNVGAHATLLRTLRNESGLDSLPGWFGLLVFLVTMVALALTVELLSPRLATGIGLLLVVGQVIILLAVFRASGLYLPLATSSVLTFVAFALVTALTYVMSERDKREIRQAFEHYLAPSVINALLDDPERLNVGGEDREMTAIFTDVEGFSQIVDRLEPQSVVALLGDYLSAMTDPILETGGTIDKYEGDAIVAFFGAPLDDPQHPRHAVDAAIAMRRLEPVLNDRIVRAGRTPVPLRTRIGVHTGHMTVGNLGTPERLDYTIIGSEVNVASRLEGVNKQYGTLSMISEETYRGAGEGLLVRRLDRVRVLGIDRPVRLYELLGYADDSTSALRESLALFEEGLDAFEQRDWVRARELFVTVRRIYPTDGPADLFIARCDEFIGNGVRESWDGVISLTEK